MWHVWHMKAWLGFRSEHAKREIVDCNRDCDDYKDENLNLR